MIRARWCSVYYADSELTCNHLVWVPFHQKRKDVCLARVSDARRVSTSAAKTLRSWLAVARRDASRTLSNNMPGSNGFSTKSTTPSFNAATAMGISPWPVITTTAGSVPSRTKHRNSVMPSISGSRTSVKRQIGLEQSTSLKKNPRLNSCARRSSRSVVEGSPHPASPHRLRLHRWLVQQSRGFDPMTGQAQNEACPCRNCCVPSETSPMHLDNLMAKRQAQPHAARFAGFKRLEQMLCDLG